MCGIAGIVTSNINDFNLEEKVVRMRSHLQHRGPDDSGIFLSKDKQAAFAHTRLAILDVSSAGHQPMTICDGRYWITFNGEIYNFLAIRQELIYEGVQFYSKTDTEVILNLYAKLGTACLKHLRGMFSFAVWDDFEKTCFLARDPLGIKPLYYWKSDSTLVFASELRAVIASRLSEVNLNSEALYGYLISGSVPEPYTLINGIHCLGSGNWLYWHAGEISHHQYWQINFKPEPMSETEAIFRVRDALLDSIENHLVSDVPIGVFLSGGIDSTALVALARQKYSGTLNTYSIAFEESAWNEGEVAKRTAEKFETQHTENVVNSLSTKKLFEEFLAIIDQPTIDGFNTFCVAHLARENGTKVILSGLGGDELFGGYSSFQKIPQMVHIGKKVNSLYPFNTWIGYVLESYGKSSKTKRLGDFLQQTPNSQNAYRSFRGIFSHQEAYRITQHYIQNTIIPLQKYTYNANIDYLPTIEDQVSFLEINSYMRNQLLRDSDVMSMACGLEIRVPFVDNQFIEAISVIPSNLRLMFNKKLLIQAIPEIPHWVKDRRKMGFSFPFQKWIQKDWHENFKELPDFRDIQLDSWHRKFSILILEYWLHNIINY
jgi:asparagine synthase (glutamine-hydrolysing)